MGIDKKIYITSSKSFEDVISLPLLEISFFDEKIDFLDYEAIIFTSQNAIKACEKISKSWREIESYPIGLKTHELALNYNAKSSDLFFSSDGIEFANKVAETLRGKKVLYPRAKKSAHNLKKIFSELGVEIDEITLYKSACQNIDKTVEDDAIVIFTSPKNVECFFQKYGKVKGMEAVAIGKTTEASIPKDIKRHLSEHQTINSCIKKALEVKL